MARPILASGRYLLALSQDQRSLKRDLRRMTGREARRVVAERHSPAVVARSYADIYRELS